MRDNLQPERGALGPRSLRQRLGGGESTFIDQEQPKTAHDPGTPKRGPQAGSNPFSYAQFTVQPRGSVQYPTSSQ